MPLKPGTSNKTIGKNIKELVGSYKKTGKIGLSKPASKEAAQKQAVAIALSSAGKTKNENFDTYVNDLLGQLFTPTTKEQEKELENKNSVE